MSIHLNISCLITGLLTNTVQQYKVVQPNQVVFITYLRVISLGRRICFHFTRQLLPSCDQSLKWMTLIEKFSRMKDKTRCHVTEWARRKPTSTPKRRRRRQRRSSSRRPDSWRLSWSASCPSWSPTNTSSPRGTRSSGSSCSWIIEPRQSLDSCLSNFLEHQVFNCSSYLFVLASRTAWLWKP